MGHHGTLRTGRNYFFVLQSGMISSAIVLLVLWAMARYWPRVYLIGWYYSFLPVGALAAGAAAVSGYILAARSAAVTAPRWLMAPIFLLQLGIYVAADYVEYRRLFWGYDPAPISFLQYFDVRSRSFSLVDGHGQEEPINGYLLRAMEMIGFAGPGLLVPLFIRSMPRCRQCQECETSRKLGMYLSVPEVSFEEWRVPQNPEEVGYAESVARATYFQQHVSELLRPLTEAIATNQPEAIQEALESLARQSDTITAPHCLTTLLLHYCPTCMTGRLLVSYRYQERGVPRFDALSPIPVGAAVIDAVPAKA